MIPQLLVLILYALALGVSTANHGLPRQGRTNVMHTLLGSAIMLGLMWWGGFFAPLGL